MDMGASVLAKLKEKSKKTGKPLQLYLQLFCQEEFLRRLSLSPYADNFVLKGGLLIYTLSNFESRTTIDIDFLLRQLPNSIEQIEKIVDTILSVNTENDFVVFSSQNFVKISPQRRYNGVSFQIIGHIKNTKTPFNVDIGVGDVIVPKSEKRMMPVQLDMFTAPIITTYSLESTIAEKFDALLQRLELTSRMKDIYDIYFLSISFDFDGRQLQQALFETLQNRGTLYERDGFDRIILLSQDNDIQVRWRQFLRRLRLPELMLDDVLHAIDFFLRPIWTAIITENEFFGQWNADNKNVDDCNNIKHMNENRTWQS
jgi:predicted nucleotidyltransferase component of viral defense system